MILLQTSTTTTVANPYFLALIALIGPLAVVIFSWVNNQITAKLQRDLSDKTVQLQRELANVNLDEKRIEERRKDISRKLDEFYAPLLQYLNKSAELAKILFKGKPKDFRTLPYLLDRSQIYSESNKPVVLTDNDNLILTEIITIGEKIETLIIDKAGLVDDPRLSYSYNPNKDITDVKLDGRNGLLAVLGTHLLLIRHAMRIKVILLVKLKRIRIMSILEK